MGIAFQLQDDYLDAFGDPETFGKQVGGDIIEHKKTYLYLKTMELGTEYQRKNLLNTISDDMLSADKKVEEVKQLFIDSGAAKATQSAVKAYTDKAFSVLNGLNITYKKKKILQRFGEQLMNRRV